MYKTIVAATFACAAFCGQLTTTQEKKPRMITATGTFDVKMLPPSGQPAPPDGFARLSLDKTFQGSLEGTSRVEMMATSDGTSPSGGYVALHRASWTESQAALSCNTAEPCRRVPCRSPSSYRQVPGAEN